MSDDIKIYSTPKGTVILEAPTKNAIIELLNEKEMTSSELQAELGLAKSTISVHLSDLKDMGILKERKHPADKRKKIFVLSSKLLGQPESPFKEEYLKMLQNLKNSSGDEYLFLKNLFHLIRYGLQSFGLDIHPALKEIGRDVGRVLAEDMDASSYDEVMAQLSDFWEKNGLGRIEWKGYDGVKVLDCFDCSKTVETGQSLCSLDEGLLEGVLKSKLGVEYSVQEQECYGTGHEHCLFKIKKVK